MASPSLALPGVVFVGEDERSRLVVHLGPAAGWMIPKGILGWSTEVSVVARDALTEDVRRDAKIVMPEEQVPPARMPLTHQAVQKAPLVAVAGRLVPKLIERGIRVHTVGADRVTSSFYYIGEGGGEDPVRVEGDLVAAVGAMLGERADNAAIERVLDGLLDRLLRSLSRDRVSELSVELAAALPRAAADGTGTQDVDLDGFEKELTGLVGSSEKYTIALREIGDKIHGTYERRLDIPLFVDVRKVSQGPFDLMVGERKVSLPTAERWVATGPFTEPGAKADALKPSPAVASPSPSPKPSPAVASPSPSPKPSPAVASPAPKPSPAVASPAPSPKLSPAASPAPSPKPVAVSAASASVNIAVASKADASRSPSPAPVASSPVSMSGPPSGGVPPSSGMKALSSPLAPPRPASNPPPRMKAESRPAAEEMVKSSPIIAVAAAVEPPKVEPELPKPEPVVETKPQPEPEPAPKVEAKAPEIVEPKAEPKAEDAKPAAKAVEAKVVDKVVEQEKSSSSKVEAAAKKAEPKPEMKKPREVDEDRDLTTQKIQRPEKKKSFPWLWLVVLAAALFAGYRFFLAH